MSFTTKYAVPHQLKDRILEFESITKRQSNFSIVFIFVSCKGKDCCVVSVGQLGLTASRTVGTDTVVEQIIFCSSFLVLS